MVTDLESSCTCALWQRCTRTPVLLTYFSFCWTDATAFHCKPSHHSLYLSRAISSGAGSDPDYLHLYIWILQGVCSHPILTLHNMFHAVLCELIIHTGIHISYIIFIYLHLYINLHMQNYHWKTEYSLLSLKKARPLNTTTQVDIWWKINYHC